MIITRNHTNSMDVSTDRSQLVARSCKRKVTMRKYALPRARARARNEWTANGKDALVTCHFIHD